MACELNGTAVEFLYGYIYGEISDRISGKNKTAIDIKGIMKKLYTELNKMPNEGFESEEDKKEKALYFAQAVPQIFALVAARPKARDYILKTNTQLFIDIPTLANEYSDIKKVEILVKPTIKTKKIAKKEVEKELDSPSAPEVDDTKPYDHSGWSAAEYSAKVVYPNGTTGQEAIKVDPNSNQPKNVRDPEKKMFGEVIRDIIYIARQTSESNTEVLYGEDEPVSLALKAMRVSDADPTMFTQSDLEFQKKNPGTTGMIAVVTDTEGNEVYFNEDGSINKSGTGGRRVYQWIRKPLVEGGKLYLQGAYGKKTSLVPAGEAAETSLKQKKEAGIIKRITPELLAVETAQILLKQTTLFNKLLKLREDVESSGKPVLLNIEGGSFGLVNEDVKPVPFAETGLNINDFELQPLRSGRYSIKINVTRPGATIDQMLVLQRSNISNDLAGHIADILTTTGKLNGRELTPTQRRVFFENFINNKPSEGLDTNPDGITVKETTDENGQAILEIRIKGEDPIEQDVLYTPETRELIYKHLLEAKTDWELYAKQKGPKKIYSAALNFNYDLMNKDFTDYVINEKGNIEEVAEDYFDFVKSDLLVEYPDETSRYFSGLNSYLTFSIPEILQEGQKLYEVGPPKVVDKDNKPKKSTTSEPKAKVTNYTKYNSAKDAFNEGKGTWGMRPARGLSPVIPFTEHFGNPWSTQKDSLNKNVVVVTDVETAVKNYEDWLTGKAHKKTEPKRRQWILDSIAKGWLDNATFIYYKPSGSKYRSHIDVLVDLINRRNQVQDADIVINEVVSETKPQPPKKQDVIGIQNSITDILKKPGRSSYLERSAKLNSFLNKIFTTKKAKDKALNWWENSFLSQVKIDNKDKIALLQRLTEVANSDAVATFENASITLWKGGNNIDIYHEAWHAFTQLFLTKEEQENLYEEVKKVNKWKDAEYFDIEEDIAEDFRSFMKSEKFKESLPTWLANIFQKISDFLRWAYGGITRKDMTRPRDIPRVREMFDVLRTNKPEEAIKKGLFQSLNASTQNVRFTKLNRGDRNIQPIKANKNVVEFTADESMLIANAMDALSAGEFQNYNIQADTTIGYLKTTKSLKNRTALYENIYDKFLELQEYYLDEYKTTALKNLNTEKVDVDLAAQEIKLKNIVDLLSKIITNYGDISQSIEGKQKTGIVAYHLKKSRFTTLKESYNEIEDTTSIEALKQFKDASGNSFSSKELASEETLMLLSGIFKPLKVKGEVVRNEDGSVAYEKDFFGLPKLESVHDMWNRLAKILEGSYDIYEMYQRISDNIENYPELEQLMNLLPQMAHIDIEGGGYKNPIEYRVETNFWQDLKKPRIRYIQLNIDKVDKDKYQTKLSKASMDVYAVTSAWESNFILGDPGINKYLEKEPGTDNNMLKLNEVVQRFSKRKNMTAKDSVEFLKALGIEMDLSSPAIYNIVYNKKLNFANEFGLDIMLDALKVVNQSTNELAKDEFRRNPLKYLAEGLDVKLRADKNESFDVQGRIRVLAEIQNEFSDGFSNFSVLNAERNRVWEHFVDNTITRVVTSINKAETYQELTTSPMFKHMHWLAKDNNTQVMFSQLLNSVFYMKFNPRKPEQYGTKRKNAKLLLQNITGTQFISKDQDDTSGSNTSSMDAVSKYLQEFHTMLLNGVEEFMRHASKNMAMGLTVSKETEIKTYAGKNKNKSKHLYIDIDAFSKGGDGEIEGAKIMMGYLSGEALRIFRFKSDKEKFQNYAGYNEEVTDKLDREVMAGEAFTLFDDILTKETQEKLYKIIEDAVDNNETDFSMMDILNEDIMLRDEVEGDIIEYFNLLTRENFERLEENEYVDAALAAEYFKKGENVNELLTKAYTYNSFIHKYETVILAYGDLAQYNHKKEEFHKRNAGLGSGGKGFRADALAMQFVNNMLPKVYIDFLNQTRSEKDKIKYRKYDGTFKTAIMKEFKLTSVYYDEYLKELTQTYTERYGDAAKAKRIAEKVLGEYKNMKVADGQGYVTLEAYRNFKWLEGNWSDQQEDLYKKVSRGENITLEDSIQFFPPYKLQYFGNIESTGLPVTSFHKFSLAPLVPGLAKPGDQLYDLQVKMLEQQIDYVTFETGSKVAHIGKGDNVFNEDGSFNDKVTFTPNTIYAEYLKNQTEINSSYKGVTIFSTQIRKMILEGLYENGEIKNTKNKALVAERANEYIRRVEFLTNLHKLELLNQLGYEEVDGQYIPTSNASMEKLTSVIRANLEKDDLLSDNLIDFIDVYEKDNSLVNDLSFHPESAKIEKLLLSIINKKVIKQKVKGEALVQMSSAFFKDYAKTPGEFSYKKKEIDAAIKKYVGTNFLPTYHKKANGFTAAMKIMISMQGDYVKLFNLEYSKGETIGVYLEDGTLDMDASLARLNEKIKDDAWLDADNEANRKAITLVGPRIPVQGLNSMEFAEVYHFLPPQAGNIIIPPAEIVAKSGADFDIDKLTLFMTNLDENGKIKKANYKTYNEFKDQYNSLKSDNASIGEIDMFFAEQKAGLENEIIESMVSILELPESYSSLITPNSNYILEPIAAELAQYVMKYNPYANKMTEKNIDPKNKDKKIISPTRVLETLYNVYKHESNIVGKRTLGLGAIENTFNVIFNTLGAYMPNEYKHIVGKTVEDRTAHLFLRHHKMKVDGKDHISLSNILDVDNEHKVADILAQLINGWVDVEKDPWIFFIQGNYETAPTLMYLLKTGVPVKEAIYFVSNPLVVEYIKEKTLAKSTYAEVLGKKADYPSAVSSEAASRIIAKYFDRNELASKAKSKVIYDTGVELAEEYLSNRKEQAFTEREMLSLIENFSKNNGKLTTEEGDLAKAMFLHFLEIEQQITGLTALKLSSNPDTSTKTTGSEIELSEAAIDELSNETKIPKELLTKMLNDSIISSFFNGPMSLAVIRPLFKLRYNKYISDYIIENSQIFRKTSNKLLGERKIDTFITMFRNDIISMIFQNAIRKYKIKDSYMSYTIKKEIPTALASELKSRGAFVKANKDGTKFMYIDEQTLKEEFESEAWVRGSEEDNSYENRNMYSLDPRTFMENGKLNFELYTRFVVEREFLRSEYPIAEMVNKSWFRKEGLDLYEANPDVDGGTLGRFIYERYITNKALDNVYNFYHLFIDKDNALASRYNNFLVDHKDNLLNSYDILNVLKLDSDKTKTVFNVYLADKDMNTDKANVYTQNLRNLADRSVMKVADKDENDRISDMFALMSNFAFLQTGLNKSKLSYTNVVDFTNFLDVMKSESESFTTALALDGNNILDQFFEKFVSVNSRKNINKGRFKDYLMDIDFETFKNVIPDTELRMKESSKITQDDKSYYRGQIEKPFIDKDGNLILFGREDELYKKAGLKSYGVSMTDNLETAVGYGEGQFERENLLFDDVWGYDVNTWEAEDAYNELQENGWWLIQIPKNINYEIVKEAGEVKVIGNKIIVPKGQYKIEQFADNYPSPTETEGTPFELKETDRTNVFQYQDQLGDKDFYEKLVDANQTVVFVRNNVNETYSNKKKNFGGQQELDKFAGNMTMNITTSLTKLGDNFQNLPKQAYAEVMRLWEEEIAHIQSINDGQTKFTPIAFPETGFGDPALMPQELFVYLSTRLFDAFGYINPGSAMYNEMQKRTEIAEGLTDQEILDQLGLEEDPFKCE